jgi:phosphate transport system permease protein
MSNQALGRVLLKSLISFLYKIWLNAPILIVALCVAVIFGFLVRDSLPFFVHTVDNYRSVFFDTQWFPSEGKFGLLALVIGTLSVLAVGLLFSVLVSGVCAFGTVVYLPQRAQFYVSTFFDCASSLPPVVVGLFGLTVLVPVFAPIFPPGFGVFCSAIVLSVLLIPAMTTHWRECIKSEYDDKIMIAESLGIGKERFILRILWPSTKGHILPSIVLYAQRGMAETLAIVMVAGNVVQIPNGFFDPVRTINSTIALEIPYAESIHRSSLFFLSLMIFFIAVSITFFARTTGSAFDWFQIPGRQKRKMGAE